MFIQHIPDPTHVFSLNDIWILFELGNVWQSSGIPAVLMVKKELHQFRVNEGIFRIYQVVGRILARPGTKKWPFNTTSGQHPM